MSASDYRAPAGPAAAELRERRSRFLAFLRPADDEDAARAAVDRVRELHPDATHHCWAWRLGWPPRERSADAGEPAGTAGVPILQVLRGAELSDAVLVVARWFGGIKLGKGGLARAYAAAARAALEEAALVRRAPTVALELEVPYERLGDLQRLLRPPEIEIAEQEFGPIARLRVRVFETRLSELEEALAALGLRGRVHP